MSDARPSRADVTLTAVRFRDPPARTWTILHSTRMANQWSAFMMWWAQTGGAR